MGWGIALAVLLCLAVLPLGVSAKYDTSGARVWLIVGPLRLRLFPVSKKNNAKKEKSEKKQKKDIQPSASGAEKKRGGSATDFFPLVRCVLDFLGDLRRKLRVNRLELKVILAGNDPCDLAANYGRACAALGNLEPHLDRLFVIRKKDLQVECDFTEDKTLVWARIDLTITIGRIFSLGFRHGIHVLRELLKIVKLRKGGALQ